LAEATRAAHWHAATDGSPRISTPAAASAPRSAAARARWLASAALASMSPETVTISTTAITPSITTVTDPRSCDLR